MNISFFLLPKSECAYLHEGDSVAQALIYLKEKGFQAVPVIDKDGKYKGIVSEGDFLWNLIEDYNSDLNTMKHISVRSIPKKWNYKPVSVDANIAELDRYIINQNFVPVVDGRGIFIGIVTRKEIIGHLLYAHHLHEENTKDNVR